MLVLLLSESSRSNLRPDVMVHGVDDIVQKVNVELLTEVQQLSCWVVGQHCHFCGHRASVEEKKRKTTQTRQTTLLKTKPRLTFSVAEVILII